MCIDREITELVEYAVTSGLIADAGVFKDTPEGDAAFMRFVESVI